MKELNYSDELARYNHKRKQYKNMTKQERNGREGRILRQSIELIAEELKQVDRREL